MWNDVEDGKCEEKLFMVIRTGNLVWVRRSSLVAWRRWNNWSALCFTERFFFCCTQYGRGDDLQREHIYPNPFA